MSSSSPQLDTTLLSTSEPHPTLVDVIVFRASAEHSSEECLICRRRLLFYEKDEEEDAIGMAATPTTTTEVMLAEHTARQHGTFHLTCLDSWAYYCTSQRTAVTCPLDRDVLLSAHVPETYLYSGHWDFLTGTDLREALVQFPLWSLAVDGEEDMELDEAFFRDIGLMDMSHWNHIGFENGVDLIDIAEVEREGHGGASSPTVEENNEGEETTEQREVEADEIMVPTTTEAETPQSLSCSMTLEVAESEPDSNERTFTATSLASIPPTSPELNFEDDFENRENNCFNSYFLYRSGLQAPLREH
ncbi:hypothetical protein H2198_001746 [Neophaeococcomyces mojaviensis]|uniref:Uncharacterized protein n=1 Tax=Neophaeococcomyces mojaviensis TaxID=3383035 RepID=A0ACC3AG33_9EURO|nr:hypothetical protein H2198_001746 [Knufia sp. JES_112]